MTTDLSRLQWKRALCPRTHDKLGLALETYAAKMKRGEKMTALDDATLAEEFSINRSETRQAVTDARSCLRPS